MAASNGPKEKKDAKNTQRQDQNETKLQDLSYKIWTQTPTHLALRHSEVKRCEEERKQLVMIGTDILTTHVAHVLTQYVQQVCDTLLEVKDKIRTGKCCNILVTEKANILQDH